MNSKGVGNKFREKIGGPGENSIDSKPSEGLNSLIFSTN